MGGIAGIYAYHYAANAVDPVELRNIRDQMSGRGPDSYGEWHSPDARIGLGHRRLAINDLSERGSQPMASPDGKRIVIFDGEIYNYLKLREWLKAKGYTFYTETDTEVLLHLYAEHGDNMVNELRGMFAFVLWDSEKQALLLGRDPYGIKPLYYSDDGWTLRFASQVKALLAGGKVSRNPEHAGRVGFYLFGTVPEPFTTFQQIRALPAGSTTWVDRGGTWQPKKYFEGTGAHQMADATGLLAAEDLHSMVRNALLDSVRHHLVADVPIGAFVSGDVETRALVRLMNDAGEHEIQTIALAFEDLGGKNGEETRIAEQYGPRHTTRVVTEREFRDDLPRFFAAMDQPTINGLDPWFASKAARELGLKVAVSGVGGAELFDGYASSRDAPWYIRALGIAALVPGVARLSERLPLRITHLLPPQLCGLLRSRRTCVGDYQLHRGLFMPWELESVVEKEAVRLGMRGLNSIPHIKAALNRKVRARYGGVATSEPSLYLRNQGLRDIDWASMAHSVETRVPFLDTQLLSRLKQIERKGGSSKQWLSSSAGMPLPGFIVQPRKPRSEIAFRSWLERDPHLQRWRQVPRLASERCSWARRWAYEVAAQSDL